MQARIKVVVFDAYGTLFDVHSVAALAGQLFPGQGATIASLWRDKQIEYTRLVSLADPDPAGSRHYLDFHTVTLRALRHTLQRLGLAAPPAIEAALMDRYARLAPYPEVRQVLETLATQGTPRAILSNGTPEMLDAVVAHADLAGLFDRLISVDAARQFKIMPSAYALALRHYPVAPREILFASSNAWDALGATWAGFTTLWINRNDLPPETIGPPPSHTGKNLTAVLDVLAGRVVTTPDSPPPAAPRHGAQAVDMSGLDYLRAIQSGAVVASPFAQIVGWRYADVEPGRVRLALTPGAHLYNNFTLHGGALATMMDAAISHAVRTLLPEHTRSVTIELKVSYIAAPTRDCGELSLLGRAVHTGRTFAIGEGRVEGADGTLYCHATATFRVLRLTRTERDDSSDR